MAEPEIVSRLLAFIAETYRTGTVDLGPEMDLIGSGIIDSTGIVELLEFVEDEFGIAFPDEDISPDNFRSPAILAAYIDRVRQ